MKFPEPLQTGTLIKRYKRFLADVETESGEIITIHCPNTGSMKNCAEPGSQIWFSDSHSEKRKYRHTWEIVAVSGAAKAGINTGLANKLVLEALEKGKVEALAGYPVIKTEVKYGSENSRIDLLLENDKEQCFVEVKSVTLGEGKVAYFPDAVTTRGHKHLRELMAMKAEGHRAVLFFCVQHTGVSEVRPADSIDPHYGQLLREAMGCGVEVLAMRTSITASIVVLDRVLPVVIK